MVVEPLQTIDACIGIATCVIKVCRIAEGYRNANQEGERTKETVQTIHNVLNTIKQTLQSRPQPSNNLSLDGHSSLQVSHILASSEECNRNLLRLISCVSKEPVTDLSILPNVNFKVERVKVAFRSGRIAELNKRLEGNLRALTLSLQPIIIDSVRQLSDHQEARYEGLMQQLQDIKTLMQGGQQQQRTPAETSRRSSARSDAIDSVIDNHEDYSDASHTRNSMQDLKVLLETYDRLIRGYEEAEAASEAKRAGKKLIRYAKDGNLAKFSELLCTSSVDVNTTDDQEYTALHHAAERGHIKIVRELLTVPAVVANLAVFVNLPNKCGSTALHECVHKEFFEVAEVLLRNGADANARTRFGLTPLLIALENEDPKVMVNLLLKHGAVDDFDHLEEKSTASTARDLLPQYQDQPNGNNSTGIGSTSNSTRAPSTSTSALSSASRR